MKPVTAVISCYNQGKVIHDTINSLLDQTYKSLRILIIDDGSEDKNTIDLLKKQKQDNPERIEVYFKENGHVASARNFGIERCDSEYVFISDGDDTYSPVMIERFVDELERHSDVGVVSSWVKTFGIAEWIVKPEGGGIENFLHKNNCPAQAMIRRKCWEEVKGYDETMKDGYEDWDFYLSVAEKGWNISIVREPLINYRIATSSMNVYGYGKRLELMSYIIKKHQDVYRKYFLTVLLEKEKAFQDKNREILERIKTIADLPPVTFGDGGMALGITAMNMLKNQK